MSAGRDISCQEIVELVTDYLEDALPRDERKAFEQHLAGLRRLHELPRPDARDDRSSPAV